MHGFKTISYRPLATTDEETTDDLSEKGISMLEENLTLWNVNDIHKHFQRARGLIISRQTLIVVFSMLLGASVLAASTRISSTSSLQQCLEQTSSYSPAFEAIELYDDDFDNGFVSRNVYRGPPTAEREHAWFSLWNQAEVLVPAAKMAELNRTGIMLDNYMKAPSEEGDGYVAGLEVFHQLHCLNYVRQFSWFLMDKYTPELLPPEFKGSTLKAIRIHADHCIETVRLALMCHADVTPVLVAMDNNYSPPRPQAEFNAHHRCRSFEKIVAWNEKHGLSTFDGDKALHRHDHGSRR